MSERKLYIEFRVYFSPRANQDAIHEAAAVVKDRLHDMFDGVDVDGNISLPEPLDVTFEVVMEVEKEEQRGVNPAVAKVRRV